MDGGYSMLGGDLDVCRMFDQYAYKVSEVIIGVMKLFNIYVSQFTYSILNYRIIYFKNLHELRMYGTYIPNEKSDSIRISVFRDMTKICEKSPIS